ncbi:hypothetical protein FRB96_009046 [Tulasnella sp. 330]|nr:hypothetical protein FRB96_009046 [Tulasnella sp. 330]
MAIKKGGVSTEVAAAGSSLMIIWSLEPNENSVVHVTKSYVMEAEVLADVPGVPTTVAKGVFLSLPRQAQDPVLEDEGYRNKFALFVHATTNDYCTSQGLDTKRDRAFVSRSVLPPPVLATLSNDALSVENKAAMVQSVIAWIINKIPLALIPTAIQPAIILLRAAIPYLGYIGK